MGKIKTMDLVDELSVSAVSNPAIPIAENNKEESVSESLSNL